MDPITQGLVGASLSQSVCKKQDLMAAGVLGILAGMAADLDVLIRSANDPLLFLEFHRQFTHSLLFIPVGGLLCALVLHPLIAKKLGLSFQLSRQQLFLLQILSFLGQTMAKEAQPLGVYLLL